MMGKSRKRDPNKPCVCFRRKSIGRLEAKGKRNKTNPSNVVWITGAISRLPAAGTNVVVDTGLSAESLDDVVGNLFGDLLTNMFDPTFSQICSGRAYLVDHIIDGTDDSRIGDGLPYIVSRTTATGRMIHQHPRAEWRRIRYTTELAHFQSVHHD